MKNLELETQRLEWKFQVLKNKKAIIALALKNANEAQNTFWVWNDFIVEAINSLYPYNMGQEVHADLIYGGKNDFIL